MSVTERVKEKQKKNKTKNKTKKQQQQKQQQYNQLLLFWIPQDQNKVFCSGSYLQSFLNYFSGGFISCPYKEGSP